MKKLVLVGVVVLASIPPAATAQVATPPSTVTCNAYVSAMYTNGQTSVSCRVDGGQSYTFYVNETDTPSAGEVLSFVHSYALTVKILQIMPQVGTATQTPFQSFNQRLVFYLSNGKITGMRMMTVN